MQLNAGLDAGECLVKSTDPNRIESTRIGELLLAVDGTEGVSNPTPPFPTDGANVEGVTLTIPMVRDTGFCEGRRRRWTTRLAKEQGVPLLDNLYYSTRLLFTEGCNSAWILCNG